MSEPVLHQRPLSYWRSFCDRYLVKILEAETVLRAMGGVLRKEDEVLKNLTLALRDAVILIENASKEKPV